MCCWVPFWLYRPFSPFWPYGASWSITILTSLSSPNGFRAINAADRHQHRSRFSEQVAAGHLDAGDILICDNAAVHFAEEIQGPLDLVLQLAGVRLLFIPTYSPELNPGELIFAKIKNHIRVHRSSKHLLRSNVWAYYRKCILHFD
jgi:transposase